MYIVDLSQRNSYGVHLHFLSLMLPCSSRLSPVTDLWKNQLQIGERNWGREKLELLERFSQERAQWEQKLREASAQQAKVRWVVGERECGYVSVCEREKARNVKD